MTIATPRTVTTRRWFDAHLHLRLILMMLAIARRVGPICQAGIAMPNTAKIKTGADAARHRAEIIDVFSRAGFPNFRPLMTILLTDDTDPRDVATWRDSGVVAAKYYPGGLYPDGGVKDLRYPNFKDVMAEMIAHDIPLSGHFESIGVHPLEAEQAAIDDFYFLADQGLRLGFEHVTSRAGLEAIRRYDASQVMATITPHDLYLTADDIYNPGRDKIVKPHNWHRSPSKTIEDRAALWAAAVSEDVRFMYGSDYAVHPGCAKENSYPPPAGCACYPAGPSIVVDLFAKHNRLDLLEDFTSERAAKFYGLELSDKQTVTFVEEEWRVPRYTWVGAANPDTAIINWLARQKLGWRMAA